VGRAFASLSYREGRQVINKGGVLRGLKGRHVQWKGASGRLHPIHQAERHFIVPAADVGMA